MWGGQADSSSCDGLLLLHKVADFWNILMTFNSQPVFLFNNSILYGAIFLASETGLVVEDSEHADELMDRHDAFLFTSVQVVLPWGFLDVQWPCWWVLLMQDFINFCIRFDVWYFVLLSYHKVFVNILHVLTFLRAVFDCAESNSGVVRTFFKAMFW